MLYECENMKDPHGQNTWISKLVYIKNILYDKSFALWKPTL